MRDKVKLIMSQIFGINPTDIPEDASPDTILAWDSPTHLNLIMALEEEFAVRFTDEQMVEMLNLDLIVETIKEIFPEN